MRNSITFITCLLSALSLSGCAGAIGSDPPLLSDGGVAGSDGGGPASDAGDPPPDPSSHDAGTEDPPDTSCVTASSDRWGSTMMPARSGRFVAEADLTVAAAPASGAFALASGAGAEWADLAAIVLFDDVSGEIRARNGAQYQAESVLAYEAGATYHIRMVVDVTRRTYSAYVQRRVEGEPVGDELRIANAYSFRETQLSVTSLDAWTVAVGTGGPPLTGCDFAVSEAPEPRGVEYGFIPEAQTVYPGRHPIEVPAGYVHQTAWDTGGGPDIEGVYAYDFSDWQSMVWRWSDTMRPDAIQHVTGPGGLPAYRVEVANHDHSSPGTAGDNPRAELFSIDPAEGRRERVPPRGNIFRDGDEYWATFAMRLAEDFPTTHRWATFVQRKFQNGYDTPVDWFTLNAHRDRIDFTPPGTPRGTFEDITTVTALRGRWTQFTFHERVSSGSDGYFAIYMDGEMVGERHGATIAAGDVNYTIHYGYYRSNEGGPGVGVIHYSPFMILRGSEPGTIPSLP